MPYAKRCLVCGSDDVISYDEYGKLHRVTSDSRIWHTGGRIFQCQTCGLVHKPFDALSEKEVGEIYETYQLYFQGQGGEQKIFISGVGKPRSAILTEHYFEHATLLAENQHPPSWLDVGCGRGDLLRALSKHDNAWHLFGTDLGDKYKATVEEIEGVQTYFADGVDALQDCFDVISMSHVLEHISQPVSFLEKLHSHLNNNGHLLIAVPNWHQNPFDLLIADHYIHFTLDALSRLVESVGFKIITASDTLIPKELVLLAQKSDRHSEKTAIEGDAQKILYNTKLLEKMLAWLEQNVAWANTYISQNGHSQLGVFGTALAATWLDHSTQKGCSFFVDEDLQRASGQYLDRPVYLPKDAPTNSVVLLPMYGVVAESISTRLNTIGDVQYVMPPDLS
ncbi:MAG: class I SAM-dependent methyltransferase [Pseudomonadota bacterium]